MKTSLQSWLRNRWLVQHKSNGQEISNLFAISDRDLACDADAIHQLCLQSYFSYLIDLRSQPNDFSKSRLAWTILSRPQM